MQLKYHLITYGCQMNTADSEEMALPLQARGFLATESLADADVAIMNTCTVREQAEHRADSNIGRLRTWKAQDPNRILIIAGCAASRWGDSIQQKYPFIDLVSPATEIDQFPAAVATVLKERWNWQGETGDTFGHVGVAGWRPSMGDNLSDTDGQGGQPAAPTFLFGTDRTAYVTIMRGCNLSCSYCIVPQVRGREKYRPMPEILDEIRAKVAQGHKEVMLLGQTVNSYYWRDDGREENGRNYVGRDSDGRDYSQEITPANHAQPITPVNHAHQSRPMDFADLLRAVNAIDGIETIRFMSPHPKHMRARTIDALRDSKKVARHIHLPLQSGSNSVLAQMKRLYTREEYGSIVSQLREAIPGVSITTDVIVGYPGETQQDFELTLSLLEEIRFNGLFAFKYSPRPGTDSASLVDDITEEEKERRHRQILALNDSIKESLLANAGSH